MTRTRVLLRSPKNPFHVVSPEQVLDGNLIGSNSGNLVFLQSAWKILSTPDVDVTADRFRVDPAEADAINERYDVYVIPLANAFRRSFESTLKRTTRLIERLRIPVVVLGVGAQSNLGYDLERLRPLDESVRAFVSAVLDRSARIGVRGEFTEMYLRSLGFDEVDTIGCPSMFVNGLDLRVSKGLEELTPESRVAMTISPYRTRMGPILESNLPRYPNLEYVAQDLDTLELLLHGESPRAARQTSDVPIHTSHPLFQEDRVRLYVEPWNWIEDLKEFDFVVGSRIHGTISALIAGTPGFVLAHDSRTLELARYFGIPFRRLRRVKPEIDIRRLYRRADYSELNSGHPERFRRFTGFLEDNGLRHVFDDGDGGRAFDARIAETPFPPVVRVSHAGEAAANAAEAAAIPAGPAPGLDVPAAAQGDLLAPLRMPHMWFDRRHPDRCLLESSP
jgi:hypothetical protein